MISDMKPPKQNDPPFSAQPEDTLKTDIVDNIPLHQASAPTPVSEAENIDGIMKDVSKEVKKVVETPKKHHLFAHNEKPKEAVHKPVPAQPVPLPAPNSGPMPRQPAPPAAPKPKSSRSVPVMVIIFTVIITAFLVVAAVSAYKK
jgi:hypothetical protein